MRNLLLLLAKYGGFLLFVLLEVLCFYIIVKNNRSQEEIWAHSANLFSGAVNERVQKTGDYFTLEAINDSLLRENAKLLESIINYRVFSKENEFQDFESLDSNLVEYKFIPTRITNKTTNKRNNFLTLNKGKKDSISVGMGVISKSGILGVVTNVSENYSLVLSILHSQSRISAAVKKNDFHGTLLWKDMDPRKVMLDALPMHATVNVGDTIVTSGYSTIFPYGIEIGKVTDYIVDDMKDAFEVELELFNDISKVTHAYVISSNKQDEKLIIIEDLEDEL